MTLTLAIESTCDDTSVALVSNVAGKMTVERMLTYTQGMHSKYGGVVPEYASRSHAERLPILLDLISTWKECTYTSVKEHVATGYIYSIPDIQSVTIAAQPGLPWSVTMWITAATMFAQLHDIPCREVNHIMWHVFSIVIDRDIKIMQLPYICLTVSGGHSDIYIVQEWWENWEYQDMTETSDSKKDVHKQWSLGRHKRWHMAIWEFLRVWPYKVTKLVQTMDDAVGDAFDKVAKSLWGPYPWGPWIDTRAQMSKKDDLEFVRQRLRKIDVSGQFSFSGIKAQVVSLLEYYARHDIVVDETKIADIAYVFQDRITDSLISKLSVYIQEYDAQTIWVVGGVSANTMLQEKLDIYRNGDIDIYTPISMRYCGDNAGMIGGVGFI